MLEQKHRRIIVITFIIGVFFLIASLGSSWSAFIGEKEKLGPLPLIYSLIALIFISYLFKISFQLSDFKKYSELLESSFSKGRSDMLKEIQKEEEAKQDQDNEVDDVPEKAKAIVPTGNFKNIDSFGKKLLVNFANQLNFVQGILYASQKDKSAFSYVCGYALTTEETPEGFKLGENLNGEAAKQKELAVIDEIPEAYFSVESGLGASKPGFLYLLPIVKDDNTIALIELASFTRLSDKNIRILEQATGLIADKLNSLVKA